MLDNNLYSKAAVIKFSSLLNMTRYQFAYPCNHFCTNHNKFCLVINYDVGHINIIQKLYPGTIVVPIDTNTRLEKTPNGNYCKFGKHCHSLI